MRRSLAFLFCAAGCTGSILGAAGTGSTGGTTTGGTTGGPMPGALTMTAGIRRLTNQEFDNAVAALFGTGGSFADGVQAVGAAVLQSASFLYIPALGTGDGAVKKLDPYETASALSFFLSASPPDDALLDAAAKNALATAAEREAQVRRLLA